MLQLCKIKQPLNLCSLGIYHSYKLVQDSTLMTVLLEYINHCNTLKNIMLVTFYYAAIMINNTENVS